MFSNPAFIPTGDTWSNTQLGLYNPLAKFAHLMPPIRQTAELLAEGKVQEALLYRINEAGFLLSDEIQIILKRGMPVDGESALIVAPNVAIATQLSPEVAALLAGSVADGKISLHACYGWPAGGLVPVAVRLPDAKPTSALPMAVRPSRGSRLRWLPVEFRVPSNYDAKCV